MYRDLLLTCIANRLQRSVPPPSPNKKVRQSIWFSGIISLMTDTDGGVCLSLEVQEVRTRRDLRQFIALPYRLYRKDPNFVPPLRSQIKDLITGPNNMLLGFGPHVKLLVLRDGRVAGRIMAGYDPQYNKQNGYQSAWFSLFECEQDEEAATALLRACEEWALRQGADFLRGPEPVDNVDQFKGLLVMGFDGPPAIMNAYNPPWYGDFLEKWGFEKKRDLYAYAFDVQQIIAANNEKVIQYAKHRYGYHVDRLDLAHLDRDTRDMHQILLETISTFQDDAMTIPTLEDVAKLARELLPVADPDIVCIARTDGTNRPIGFVVALPDYNRVFRHIRDGRLFPFGIFKLLYYRKRIDAVRVFMQFVVPDFHRKAVNNAIFYEMCRGAAAKSYRIGDGSTIGEENMPSRLSVERLGARHYRTYRIYKKRIRPSDA
jgi:hypothetical protein